MESNYSTVMKNSSDDVFMAEPFILTMFKENKQGGNGSVDFVALMKALEDWRYKLNLTWAPQDASCSYYCSGRLAEVILAYNSIHGYISLLVCMFGSLANILNVAVLTRRDLAATPINRLLKWLAVADVFVMLEYIPFTIYKYFILPGQMDFPYSWAAYMLFHMHFAQLLHTTSICLTISLAVWRYIAIKYPERSHVLCTERRCSLAIVSSFLLPPILCTPAFMVFKIRTTVVIENATPSLLYHLDSDPDGTLYQVNFWIHAVIIKLLPCFILTVISAWLIRALNQATRRKQALKTYDSCPAGANGISNTVIISRRRKKSERRRDRTTKMLLAVLWLFLITEFPQGVLGLLSGVLGKCFFKKCYNLFGELMDILALMNGSINFILYCSMSRQFRMTFGHIFINRMFAKWPAGSQTDMQSTGRSSVP